MRINFSAACIALCLSSPALSQAIRTIYTVPNAVLCSSLFNLREAKMAAAAGDAKWLADLDCAQTAGGLPATVIESSVTFGYFKVRVYSADGKGFTAFGALQDFVEPKGPQRSKSLKPPPGM